MFGPPPMGAGGGQLQGGPGGPPATGFGASGGRSQIAPGGPPAIGLGAGGGNLQIGTGGPPPSYDDRRGVGLRAYDCVILNRVALAWPHFLEDVPTLACVWHTLCSAQRVL